MRSPAESVVAASAREERAPSIIVDVMIALDAAAEAMAAKRIDLGALARDIRSWGRALGFAQVGIADIELSAEEARLLAWLGEGRHGEMHYMARHGARRARPAELVPGTIRVITTRLDYLPPRAKPAAKVLADGDRAYLALAARSGLGWQGKHTLLLSRDAGSWFFLGEIYTDLPLPVTRAAREHCGSCHACIDACPTGAIVAPYQLDARRCISYLTIELRGSIPEALRPLIGNRVYGCDDCQLVCPWNKYAQPSPEPDFAVRHGLDDARLVELFGWSEKEFEARTEGSAIRRISYECWLRNLAVGLGNAPYSKLTVAALRQRADDPSPLVREHVAWALEEQERRRAAR